MMVFIVFQSMDLLLLIYQKLAIGRELCVFVYSSNGQTPLTDLIIGSFCNITQTLFLAYWKDFGRVKSLITYMSDLIPGKIINISRALDRGSRSATPHLSIAQAPDDFQPFSRVDRLLDEIHVEVAQLTRTKQGKEFEGLLKRQLERVSLAVKAVQQAAAPSAWERRDEPYFAADWQQFERAWERETRASTLPAASNSLETLLKEREQLQQDIKELYQRDPYYRTSI